MYICIYTHIHIIHRAGGCVLLIDSCQKLKRFSEIKSSYTTLQPCTMAAWIFSELHHLDTFLHALKKMALLYCGCYINFSFQFYTGVRVLLVNFICATIRTRQVFCFFFAGGYLQAVALRCSARVRVTLKCSGGSLGVPAGRRHGDGCLTLRPPSLLATCQSS